MITRHRLMHRSAIAAAVAAAMASLGGLSQAATTYYWDLNGSAAGAGSDSPSGVWDLSTTNWTTNATGTNTPAAYVSSATSSSAVFAAGDDATGSYDVTVSGGLSAASVRFEDGAVTLHGADTPALTVANSLSILSSADSVTFDASLGSPYLYQSQTWSNASANALVINSGLTFRTGSARSMTFEAGDAGIVVNGVVAGGGSSGGFIVSNALGGSGSVTLNNTNTYSSPTTVSSGGTLIVNGTLSNAPRTVVLATGTLAGAGSIANVVTVAAGGMLRGGNGTVGTTLTLGGSLDLQDGSTVALTLGDAGSHSTLARNGSGTWTFDSDQQFTFDTAGTVNDGAVFEGIIIGLAADPGTLATWQILNPDWVGSFSYDSGDGSIDLLVSSVPEPGVLTPMALGCGLMLRRRRLLRRGNG